MVETNNLKNAERYSLNYVLPFFVFPADIEAERLELARQLGATHTVLFGEDETDAQTNAQKLRDTLGDEIDVAIECSGIPLCLQTSIYVGTSRASFMSGARLQSCLCFRLRKYPLDCRGRNIRLCFLVLYLFFFFSLFCPQGLTVTWWGCCSLFQRHKPTERAHSFFYILVLCLFLSLWHFQLYFIP